MNGSAGKPGGGSWSTASDLRLKEVQGRFTRGLAALEKLTPVYYQYKAGNPAKMPAGQQYVGLIAQEVAEVIPEAVSEFKDGFLSVNNDPVIWTLLNAVKELKSKNDDLKARLDRLESALETRGIKP